jgi:hypothetical protein
MVKDGCPTFTLAYPDFLLRSTKHSRMKFANAINLDKLQPIHARGSVRHKRPKSHFVPSKGLYEGFEGPGGIYHHNSLVSSGK